MGVMRYHGFNKGKACHTLYPSHGGSLGGDRKDSRKKKETNIVRNLEFNRAGIRGKWVLILDDITTRGTSFVQCAEKLYANGAEYVCGFFMGKTVDQ